MIILQDLLDDLAWSELANVKLGRSDNLETIVEKDYPRVISAINQALLKIYQRLQLRTRDIKLHQQDGVTKYTLRTANTAEVGSFTSTKYFEVSTAYPFEDDLIKFLRAVDSDGEKVRVNDRAYPCDIFTTEYDTIEIIQPQSVITNLNGKYRDSLDIFTLTYSASYPKILLTETFDPLTYELDIPNFIEEALLLYVSWKLFRKPVKLAKGEVAPSSTLMIEFENAMRVLENQELEMDDDESDDKISRNGWA